MPTVGMGRLQKDQEHCHDKNDTPLGACCIHASALPQRTDCIRPPVARSCPSYHIRGMQSKLGCTAEVVLPYQVSTIVCGSGFFRPPVLLFITLWRGGQQELA